MVPPVAQGNIGGGPVSAGRGVGVEQSPGGGHPGRPENSVAEDEAGPSRFQCGGGGWDGGDRFDQGEE